MNITNLPLSIESVLDLFPPNLLKQMIEYQTKLDEAVDDWEPRHLNAYEQVFNYVDRTYAIDTDLVSKADVLAEKLDLLNS